MPNPRLSLVIPADVYARLCETAAQMGLKPNTLAARVIETADANGDYDIARSTDYPCPFSRDRLHELRFTEKKSLIEIGRIAQSVMAWEAAPRPATVRLWIETFGMTAGRDRLSPRPLAARNQARPDIPPGHCYCSRCALVKLEEDFYIERARPTGRSTYCKQCKPGGNTPAKMREWYQRNRERKIERSRENRARRKTLGDE